MTKESKTVAHASPINGFDGMSFKDVLNSVTAAVAVLAALSFIASAVREWAYYFGLGASDFISLSSAGAYASAALRGSPLPFVLFVAGGVITQILIWPTFRRILESPRLSSPRQPNGKFSRRSPCLGYLFFTSLAVFGFFFGQYMQVRTGLNPATSLMYLSAGCWGLFVLWFFTHPPERYARLGRRIAFLLFCGPVVFAWIVAGGYDEAILDLALERGEYRIVRSNGLVEDDVQLLRALSQGVLILRVPTRDVSFLTYGSFKSIDKIGSSQ